MDLHDDLEYFEQRAEAEIELAQKADNENAVHAHYMMAGIYLDRIHGSGTDEAKAESESVAGGLELGTAGSRF
jgi:hypothetical protein